MVSMADTSLNFSFVMSERKNGKFLYIHEQKQLYSFAAPNKNGKTFRCIQHIKGCKSRVIMKEIHEKKECKLADKWVPHSQHDNCEERFNRLKALEKMKTELQDIKSGSRLKRPREVYESVVVK